MWITFLWTNPIARKVTIGVLVILALGYALRRYSNRIYDEGYKFGKVAGMVGMEKTKRAEWKAKAESIATDAAALATQKATTMAAAGQLAKDRQLISRGLKDSLAAIQAERTRDYASIVRIDASDLDGALRALSTELAGTQR
jgi:hypothetical protein